MDISLKTPKKRYSRYGRNLNMPDEKTPEAIKSTEEISSNFGKNLAKARKLSIIPTKNRLGRKKANLDKQAIHETISEQFIKASMNQQPDNAIESNLVEKLTINSANFRPAVKIENIIFNVKKDSIVIEHVLPD